MFHFEKDFIDKNGERMMEQTRIRKMLDVIRAQYYMTHNLWLTDVFMREGKYGSHPCGEGEWRLFDTETGIWGKPGAYFTFRLEAVVPEEMDGRELWYGINPRDDGSWEWANPQGLLYVNGKPLQAMDSNHSTVRLSESCKAGDRYELYYYAYTDTLFFKNPLRFKSRLMAVDPSVEAFWYDLLVPFDNAQILSVDDYRRHDTLNCIVEALNMLDMRKGYGPEFSASREKASAYFNKEFYEKYADKAEDVMCTAIGHTHIDVAWLWDLAQTRDKTSRTFTTVLHLMEDYPEFRFMSSQSQLYAFIKEDAPELYEKVKARVLEGRWEAEGGLWLEADMNLASGEALVRQFVHGKNFFQSEFGVDNRILWLPDVFGYCAALPQIMKKSGVDYFMTTKISWNEYNKLPYDTFMWRGIDGSEVLTHFIPTRAYEEPEKDWMSTYNGWIHPTSVIGGWKRYQQKNLNRGFMLSYGHGDGGGGPDRGMIETARRIERGIPGCPRLKFGSALRFFEELEKDVAEMKNLPRWVGEIYFEYHRGTYTTIAKTKLYNRRAEVLMHDAEWLYSLVKLLDAGAAYPKAELDAAWKVLLLNQFHDILPGSSIKDVYDQSWEQYEALFMSVGKLADAAKAVIAEHVAGAGDSIVLLNTAPVASSGPVYCSLADLDGKWILDGEGKTVDWQETFDGRAVFVPQVSANSAVVYSLTDRETPEKAGAVTADLKHMENDFIYVGFNENMNIISLREKRTGRELVKPHEALNRMVAFEDRPAKDDAWNIQAYYTDRSWEIDNVASAEVIELGSCRAVIRVVREFLDSRFTQDFVLYAGSARLDVECDFDWRQKYILLKAVFPLNVNAVKAAFDVQFGNLERNTHENTLWDFAQFEVCAHKWADLSDNGAGLSVLNNCKYGHSAKDNTLTLSLLRGTTYPNPEADEGRHVFTYSIYPHAGTWREAGTVREAYSLNYPLHCIRAAGGQGKAAEVEMASCGAANVLVETIKEAEADAATVLRLYEYENRPAKALLKVPETFTKAEVTDLLERKTCDVPIEKGLLTVDVKPFEIVTVKLY